MFGELWIAPFYSEGNRPDVLPFSAVTLRLWRITAGGTEEKANAQNLSRPGRLVKDAWRVKVRIRTLRESRHSNITRV